jgi:hypothetical protein
MMWIVFAMLSSIVPQQPAVPASSATAGWPAGVVQRVRDLIPIDFGPGEPEADAAGFRKIRDLKPVDLDR